MRILRYFRSAWRFISEAEFVIQILAYAGLTVSTVVAAVVAAWAWFSDAPLVAILVLGIGSFAGLTAAFYYAVRIYDRWRFQEERELRERYKTAKPSDEKGFLDIAFESEQAIKDATSVFVKTAKYTGRVAKKLAKKSTKLFRAKTVSKRYEVANGIAEDISFYTAKLHGELSTLNQIVSVMSGSYVHYIEQMVSDNELPLERISELFHELKLAESTARENLASWEQLKETVDSLKRTNITMSLNSASESLSEAITDYIVSIDKITNTFKRIIDMIGPLLGNR